MSRPEVIALNAVSAFLLTVPVVNLLTPVVGACRHGPSVRGHAILWHKEAQYIMVRKDKDDDQKNKGSAEEKPGRFAEKEIFPNQHYNNEVLGITLDYLDLLKKPRTAGLK